MALYIPKLKVDSSISIPDIENEIINRFNKNKKDILRKYKLDKIVFIIVMLLTITAFLATIISMIFSISNLHILALGFALTGLLFLILSHTTFEDFNGNEYANFQELLSILDNDVSNIFNLLSNEEITMVLRCGFDAELNNLFKIYFLLNSKEISSCKYDERHIEFQCFNSLGNEYHVDLFCIDYIKNKNIDMPTLYLSLDSEPLLEIPA